uniref:Uncharacterized protein n=1 Tax=Meloidogyne enterolobii TaxID=390850 RepID=A0A6V7X8X4_MELEN|nr:unnamed protein product [Meloidogyne enterolobii]
MVIRSFVWTKFCNSKFCRSKFCPVEVLSFEVLSLTLSPTLTSTFKNIRYFYTFSTLN